MSRFSLTAMRMLALGLSLLVAGPAGAQQAYPNKPIRLIVPFPPGGGTNIIARLVGQKLAENVGQQVIVDNRPGGSTIIGTDALAKSPPDGYSLIIVGSSHVVNSSLLSTPYDPIKDFAAVAPVTSTELMLVLNPAVPANNLQELVALAKSKPGQLNYATPSTGGPMHLAAELFNIMVGTKMQHVPYKGSGPATVDLIAGQVQLAFQTPLSAIAQVKGGRLKAIAVSGETRLAALPQLPTFTEAGLPNFKIGYWYGILAPAGTPKAIVDLLNGELRKALNASDVREKLQGQGMDPYILSTEEFAALMKTDMARYAKIVKAANIKLEN